ncbi:globin domain-containing protein [Mangrovimicrobium sediminis]|uniref:globin domain-containing protein n=1 Tax=Mangrovimicrobium sediminis TaxID=2562682 RepID=UPI0014368DE6|nr:globin domain-containing protein [Haliea sp. SAOS-164]
MIADTWALLAPAADQFTALFYERIQKLDPKLRRHFPEDSEQSRQMASLLDTIIATLDLMDNLRPALQAMGARYAELGMTERDYHTTRSALLWTLEQALGQRFADAEREAWGCAFDTLASVMLQSARENREEAQQAPRQAVEGRKSEPPSAPALRSSPFAMSQAFAGEPPGPSSTRQ